MRCDTGFKIATQSLFHPSITINQPQDIELKKRKFSVVFLFGAGGGTENQKISDFLFSVRECHTLCVLCVQKDVGFKNRLTIVLRNLDTSVRSRVPVKGIISSAEPQKINPLETEQ